MCVPYVWMNLPNKINKHPCARITQIKYASKLHQINKNYLHRDQGLGYFDKPNKKRILPLPPKSLSTFPFFDVQKLLSTVKKKVHNCLIFLLHPN